MRDRHAICSTPRMRFAFASFVAIGSIVACSSTETITPDPSSYEVAATPLPHDAVATPPPADAPPIDASTEAAAPCTARFACAADGMSRAKCATVEPCARGCLRNVACRRRMHGHDDDVELPGLLRHEEGRER